MTSETVLLIVTSHDDLGNTGKKTGFWYEELAAPYYVFKDAGLTPILVSPTFSSRDRRYRLREMLAAG